MDLVGLCGHTACGEEKLCPWDSQVRGRADSVGSGYWRELDCGGSSLREATELLGLARRRVSVVLSAVVFHVEQ